MLDVKSVNHIGIRVSDKSQSIIFYQRLGFKFIVDHGFNEGHPVVMKHSCGVTLNILGFATDNIGKNILMDIDKQYSGYTHIALTVSSLQKAKDFLKSQTIEQTGSFSFKGMSAIFFRDPDRNVIELDAYDDTFGTTS